MATRLLVGSAVLLEVSSHRIHLGLWHFHNADNLTAIVVVIVAEYGFSAIVLTQAVTAYVLVSNFAATDWANDFNVKVFFVSHVVTFRE